MNRTRFVTLAAALLIGTAGSAFAQSGRVALDPLTQTTFMARNVIPGPVLTAAGSGPIVIYFPDGRDPFIGNPAPAMAQAASPSMGPAGTRQVFIASDKRNEYLVYNPERAGYDRYRVRLVGHAATPASSTDASLPANGFLIADDLIAATR